MDDQCCWILDRGYWRGKRCANPGQRSVHGRRYCHVHASMAEDGARLLRQERLRAASKPGV